MAATTVDLGRVIGPTGPTGPKGDTGPKGNTGDNANMYIVYPRDRPSSEAANGTSVNFSTAIGRNANASYYSTAIGAGAKATREHECNIGVHAAAGNTRGLMELGPLNFPSRNTDAASCTYAAMKSFTLNVGTLDTTTYTKLALGLGNSGYQYNIKLHTSEDDDNETTYDITKLYKTLKYRYSDSPVIDNSNSSKYSHDVNCIAFRAIIIDKYMYTFTNQQSLGLFSSNFSSTSYYICDVGLHSANCFCTEAQSDYSSVSPFTFTQTGTLFFTMRPWIDDYTSMSSTITLKGCMFANMGNSVNVKLLCSYVPDIMDIIENMNS